MMDRGRGHPVFRRPWAGTFRRGPQITRSPGRSFSRGGEPKLSSDFGYFLGNLALAGFQSSDHAVDVLAAVAECATERDP